MPERKRKENEETEFPSFSYMRRQEEEEEEEDEEEDDPSRGQGFNQIKFVFSLPSFELNSLLGEEDSTK